MPLLARPSSPTSSTYFLETTPQPVPASSLRNAGSGCSGFDFDGVVVDLPDFLDEAPLIEDDELFLVALQDAIDGELGVISGKEVAVVELDAPARA